MAKYRFILALRDFLKSISCCHSSCMNTYENITIEHFEAMTDRIEMLTDMVHALRGIEREPIRTETPEPALATEQPTITSV